MSSEAKTWIAASMLMLAGGWITAMNLWIVAGRLRGNGKHHSLGPLLGGGLCAAALLTCPMPGAASLAWVPLVVDPGCAYALLSLFYAVFFLKAFKR